MKIKIIKEFGRQLEFESLCRSEIQDFLYDNQLQGGTVKRIIGLIGSKIPLITIKKRGYRAKNGDLMVFAGLSDRMLGVLGYGGFGGCLGENSTHRDREGATHKEGKEGREREESDCESEGTIINCSFVRKSYIGDGIIIKIGGKMGGKLKELKGNGRSFEQSVLALKQGNDIAIRYIDDYNWGVL